MASTLSLTEISVPGKQLCGLTWKNQLLWFSDSGLNTILGINPQTGELAGHIKCPEVRTGLTAINDDLLQVVGSNRTLRLINPRGETIREFPNPRPGLELCDIEFTPTGVWLGYHDPPMLDLRTLPHFELIENIPVDEAVAGVTVISRYVAYSTYAAHRVHVIDSRKKQVVATLKVAGNPTGLTWDGQLLWYCDYTNLLLRAIDLPASLLRH